MKDFFPIYKNKKIFVNQPNALISHETGAAIEHEDVVMLRDLEAALGESGDV